VHQGGLALFKPTMQKLLNSEHFYQKIPKNQTTIYFKEIWASFLILLETL
jgi:hypothetical protein